jgi:hypothetical protein
MSSLRSKSVTATGRARTFHAASYLARELAGGIEVADEFAHVRSRSVMVGADPLLDDLPHECVDTNAAGGGAASRHRPAA